MVEPSLNDAAPPKMAPVDLEELQFIAKRRFQVLLDKMNPKRKERWAAFTVVLAIFLIRVYVQQGYAVIAYLLGLFYLNILMLYLAPAEDFEDMAYNDYELPTRETDEYKGF
jgi:hypothetical protein